MTNLRAPSDTLGFASTGTFGLPGRALTAYIGGNEAHKMYRNFPTWHLFPIQSFTNAVES